MTIIFPIICSLLIILACSFTSHLLKHGIEKDLILAALRAIAQLFLLGHILSWVFQESNLAVTLIMAMVMTFNAAYHSRSRVKHPHQYLFLDNLVATSLAIWPLAFFGSFLMDGKAWMSTEVLLPMFGMLLGNTLSGIATGVDQFTFELNEKKDEIISYLALGATVKESTRLLFSRSIRLAMSPNLNSMFTMGIVSIPGMMTGQILAGVSPIQAAVVQIIIMLLIASATYTGSVIGLNFAKRRMFNLVGQPCF